MFVNRTRKKNRSLIVRLSIGAIFNNWAIVHLNKNMTVPDVSRTANNQYESLP